MRFAVLLASNLMITSAIGTQSAVSGTLDISPLSFELQGAEQSSLLRVRNAGSAPASLQVRVFKWQQKNGRDVLDPTRDIIASPPIARLNPGVEQIVRIVRVSKQPINSEEAYRLVVSDLPSANITSGIALTMVLQYSIPVFVLPPPGAKPNLTWRSEVIDGEIKLRAFNMGAKREKFTELTVLASENKIIGKTGAAFGYVLARSSNEWVFPRENLNIGDKLTITAQGESGKVQFVVPVEAPH